VGLSIQLAPKHKPGLLLANPVMTASDTFGYGTEYGQLFDIQRLGAFQGRLSLVHPPHRLNLSSKNFDSYP